jgi:hypothetical protein
MHLPLKLTTVSRSLVANYSPHLTAESAAGQELQKTLEWSAREMLAKYLRKFRTRRQFVGEQMGGMYTDEMVNCVGHALVTFMLPWTDYNFFLGFRPLTRSL